MQNEYIGKRWAVIPVDGCVAEVALLLMSLSIRAVCRKGV